MVRFPLFPERAPKTMEEVAQQVHDSRLLGMGLLLAGAILVGAGLPSLLARQALADNGLFLAGTIQLGLGTVLTAVVPSLLARRWQKRLRGY